MYISAIAIPLQGVTGAPVRLDFIDDAILIDPITGELFDAVHGLAWASYPPETDHCGNPITPAIPQGETGDSGPSLVKGSRSLAPWYDRRTHKGRKVRRTIDHETRVNAIEAAGYAADRGTPLTLHVTQRPDLDAIDPASRVASWIALRHRMAKASENCGFPFNYIRTRESNAGTHANEHGHWLVAVPGHCIDRWKSLVLRQCPDTKITHIYDLHGIVRYILKATTVQTLAIEGDAVRYRRRSGAVAGDRVLISRSLDRKRREAAYAADPALVDRRDGRLRMEERDKEIRKEKRIAAGRRMRNERVAEIMRTASMGSEAADLADLNCTTTT